MGWLKIPMKQLESLFDVFANAREGNEFFDDIERLYETPRNQLKEAIKRNEMDSSCSQSVSGMKGILSMFAMAQFALKWEKELSQITWMYKGMNVKKEVEE